MTGQEQGGGESISPLNATPIESPPPPREKSLAELKKDAREILTTRATDQAFLQRFSAWKNQLRVFQIPRPPEEERGTENEPPLSNQEILAIMMAEKDTLIAQLETQREIDPLTETYNRRGIERRSQEILSHAARAGESVSYALFDLDRFKDLNDQLGHAGGDACLVETVAYVRSLIRQSDVLGRMGGEEFILILPDTDEAGADKLIKRIGEQMDGSLRSALEKKGLTNTEKIPLQQLPDIHFTTSVGIAQADLTTSKGPKQVFKQTSETADARVYLAKNSGKDRIVSSVNEQQAKTIISQLPPKPEVR